MLVRESPIAWLLERSNPSVRYFTLLNLLGKSEEDVEVIFSKKAIPKSSIISKIFTKQYPEGYWGDSTSPYFPKYRSSYWQLMVLGQLGMDKGDERVKRACDNIFHFQLDGGGFPCYSLEQVANGRVESHTSPFTTSLDKENGRQDLTERADNILFEHQYSCLTGNMLAALIRMGYEDDPRVKKGLLWLVDVQNKDGGWLCPYWRAHRYDKHGCFYGTVCSMEAFSEVPGNKLTKGMKHAVERSSEFLLMHHLYRADHHGYRIVNKSWLRLEFPWFYRYNILRGLDILTKIGYVEDERISDAVQVLLQKRRSDGKWTLESAPIGRMQANLEAKDKPSKWVTLIALRVLKRISAAR